MTNDELSEYLNTLARDDCYRVVETLKQTDYETTQKVYFVGSNGALQGPYVKKRIKGETGLGRAYHSIFLAQKEGRRFTYLPHIFDYYVVDDDIVVIMEYLQGETLQQIVYRCDPSVFLARDIFPRLCSAVEELHKGFVPALIHRDLKPSNIMLSRDTLTIIDFGIARTFSEEASDDTFHFGTRAYAPPEQFGFGQTDQRSDIYALGMLLYFCLTEKTPEAKVRQRGFLNEMIPEPLSQLLVRATQLDPRDRFQNVDQLRNSFLAAIQRIEVAGGGVLAPSIPFTTAGFVPQVDRVGLPPTAVDNQGFPIALSKDPKIAAGQCFDPKQKSSLLARVPARLGIAWNVVLLITLALFLFVVIGLIINPTPGSSTADSSLLKRIIMDGSVFLFFFVPVFYLICDRRPFKRRFEFFRKLTPLKEFALYLVSLGIVVLSATIVQILPN